MKAVVILSDGFEDIEALAPIDLLKRSGIEVTTCSLDSYQVTSQYGHIINSNLLIKDLIIEKYQILILPGGGAVNNILVHDQRISELIKGFYLQNCLICAICAGPLLIGRLGLFNNLEYTCFPGCEQAVTAGKYKNIGVVANDKFITAKSVYYAIDFALAIIEKVQGIKQRNLIYQKIRGEI